MIWLRSPAWDGSWLLSGLPIGAALTLVALWLPVAPMLFWVILLAQTGHTIAPITAAWGHREFRAMMLRRQLKFAALPLVILAAAVVAGWVGSGSLHGIHFNPNSFSIAEGPQSLADLGNPFLAMVAIYALWNGWHFGRQNFGVMSLYRQLSGIGSRRRDLVFCCGVTWATMLMPFIPRFAHGMHELIGWPAGPHPFLDYVRPFYFSCAFAAVALMLWGERRNPGSASGAKFCLPRLILILTQGVGLVLVWFAGLWGLAIVAINHWLTAIGLASLISGSSPGRAPGSRQPTVLVAWRICFWGALLFTVLFVNPFDIGVMGWQTFTAPQYILHFTVIVVAFRLGLGFVHFLYDRWLYRFSDPVVQATIARDVFGW